MSTRQVKVLQNVYIFKKRRTLLAQGEVNILARMRHPFIAYLFGMYHVGGQFSLLQWATSPGSRLSVLLLVLGMFKFQLFGVNVVKTWVAANMWVKA